MLKSKKFIIENKTLIPTLDAPTESKHNFPRWFCTTAAISWAQCEY